MKNKDYAVSINKQSGYINTESKPETELVTKCIVCGKDVVISERYSAPKVCEDCKKAIAYAKEHLKEKEELEKKDKPTIKETLKANLKYIISIFCVIFALVISRVWNWQSSTFIDILEYFLLVVAIILNIW